MPTPAEHSPTYSDKPASDAEVNAQSAQYGVRLKTGSGKKGDDPVRIKLDDDDLRDGYGARV